MTHSHPIDTDIVVIYHANCYDGFGGAWAAWKKFGDSATYIPAKYGEHLPEDIDGREVYVIDFSYDATTLPELEKRARRLVVIDHHQTAAAFVPKMKEFVFDMSHSGAYLAWQYFHPSEPVPLFVEYLSDADLYHFTRPHAEEIIAYLHALPLTFESYERMHAEIEGETSFTHAIEKGELLITYRNKVVEPALESVQFVELAEHIVPAVNMCLPMSEVSYALHQVYAKYPPVSLSYRLDDGQWKCSLRSNGDIDCAKIAEQFGGGGHPGAAGFAIPFEDGKFPFKIVKEGDYTDEQK